MKYYISIFILFWITNTLYSQFNNDGFTEFKMEHFSTLPSPQKTKPTVVSKEFLQIEISNGQKYLIHTVQAGQTIYAIKKFYGVDFSDIYYSNAGLETRGLRVGQKLKIPIINKAIIFFKKPNFVAENFIPIFYRVRSGETMFRLSRVYFRIPADILKSRNNLSSDVLSKNQLLHIGWLSKNGIPDSLKQYTGISGLLGEQNKINKYRYEALLAKGKKEQKTDGTACWDKKMNLSAKNKLYVMCSYVPAGSVVRIENPMSKRFLYAKVVAPKPENSFTEDAIIMLTPTVANTLGALDARFNIRLYYCK